MPQVPQYQPGQVRMEAPNAPPASAGVPAGSFGAAGAAALGRLGETIEQSGEMLGSFILRQQSELDQTRAREAFTQARLESQDFLREQFQSRRGRGAQGLLEDDDEFRLGLKDRILESLDNDRQRQLFGLAFDNYAVDHRERAAVFQAGQIQAWKETSLGEANVAAIEDAAGTPFDEKALAQARKEIIGNLTTRDGYKGEEALNSAIRKDLTTLYATVAERIALKDTSEALAFLRAHKQEMQAEVANGLEARWQRLAPIEQGSRLADQILAKVNYKATDFLAALEKAAGSPEVKEAARDRGMEVLNKLRQAVRVQDEESVKAWSEQILALGPTATTEDMLQLLKNVKPLSAETRLQMEQQLAARIKAQQDANFETAESAFYATALRAAYENPNAFRNSDLMAIFGMVSTEHWRTLKSIQEGLRTAATSRVEDVVQMTMTRARILDSLDPSAAKLDDTERMRRLAVLGNVADTVRREARELDSQGKLTPEAMRDLAERSLTRWNYGRLEGVPRAALNAPPVWEETRRRPTAEKQPTEDTWAMVEQRYGLSPKTFEFISVHESFRSKDSDEGRAAARSYFQNTYGMTKYDGKEIDAVYVRYDGTVKAVIAGGVMYDVAEKRPITPTFIR